MFAQEFAQEFAQKINDDIIYGLDNDALRWHKARINQELRGSKHKWIPHFLWQRIIKGIVID